MASMMTKRKMLARLTIASAIPARLIGLRSSIRERCHGSTGGAGLFSLSMLDPCHGRLILGCGFTRDGRNDRSSNYGGVESMFVLIVVQRHFSIPPCPVHGVNIRIEEHLV